MEYRRKEIGAGLVIVIAVGLLVLMVVLSSNVQDLFREKKEFSVRFGSAEGVEINIPVKQVGMLVGKVSGIKVGAYEGHSKIVLTLRVLRDTVVKRDSSVTIKSPLVGEKYVDIGLGTPESPALMPGDTLDGIEGLSLDEMTDTIVAVVEDIQSIVSDVKEITGDPQFQRDIKTTLENLENASSEVDELIRKNSGNLDATFRDLRKVASELDSAVTQLDRLVRDVNRVVAENRYNIHSTLQSLRDTPDQLLAEIEAVEKSITGPMDENREDMKKIMENLEKITQNLVEMTEELKKNPWRIIRK